MLAALVENTGGKAREFKFHFTPRLRRVAKSLPSLFFFTPL